MSASILIANRDAKQRQVLRDWLELEGFECSEVASGTDAVEQIVTFRPDVALIDNELEQFDGIELLLHLRQDLIDRWFFVNAAIPDIFHVPPVPRIELVEECI